MEQLKRTYIISDPEMHQISRVKREAFEEDKATFILFDGMLADPFSADWLLKNEEAEAQPTDERIIDEQTQITQTVAEIMAGCRNFFNNSRYFIERAFGKDNGKLSEFGYDNYSKVRLNQSKMINFMDALYDVADKYRAQLLAVGATDLQINQAKVLADVLRDQDKQQEHFKNSRKTKTQNRISINNDLWEMVKRVCRVGKIIFRDNYARYQMYLLPASEESDEFLSIKGTIIDSVTFNKLEDVSITLQPGDFNVTSDNNGQYGFGILSPGTYSINIQKDGYTPQTINDVVVEEGIVTIKNIVLVK